MVGGECSLDNFQRVSVLAEALPYLQRFAGQTIVVKYGGAAMTDEGLKDRVIRDLVLLSTVGIRPILVHGGGPEINQWLAKVGIEPVRARRASASPTRRRWRSSRWSWSAR